MRCPVIETKDQRFAVSEDGVAVIEFAIIAPFLFFLLLGIVEGGLALAARHELQSAVHDAARAGRLGPSGQSEDERSSRQALLRKHTGLGLLDLQKIALEMRAYDGFANVSRPEPFDDRNGNGQWDAGESFTDVNGNGRWDKDQGRNGLGGASQIVVYEASYAWTFFTPLIAGLAGDEGGEGLQLTARAIVQNEPY